MKLIRAQFKNFRLLKDLTLDFSIDPNKPLTVIRAENGSGKTTAQSALIWGLYGSKALPSQGKKYPICPADALSSGLKRVEISVEIEFETDQVVSIGKSKQEIKTIKYRLNRSCFERPSKEENVIRETEIVILHEITPNGVNRVLDSNVKGIIESSIPEALKDVYFSDGDSAMSFIEASATSTVKRKRVQSAIEALLGLNVLETTIKHLDLSAKKFSSQIDNTNYNAKLENLNDTIDGHNEDITSWTEDLETIEVEIKEGDSKLVNIKDKIESILKLGDKTKLVNEIKNCELHIKRNQEGADKALLTIASLMRDNDVAISMISKPAIKGYEILNKLHDSKQLPKVNVPILEELLDRTICFCGASLDKNSGEGIQRLDSIRNQIENSRSADELQESASSLFYSVRSENFDNLAQEQWITKYNSHSNDYQRYCKVISDHEKELIKKNAEIDQINDDQIIELRECEKTLIKKLNNARVKAGQLQASIKEYEERLNDAKRERNNIESKLDKKDNSTDKLQLSRLMKKVFENVFDRLRKDEVKTVSYEMNRIFLGMIGEDPENNKFSSITGAELTENFDILVYGLNGKQMDPDQDLNGASRRAITLAFILALTKVSEVKAPNIIDTPLGMMSGYVKQSVLNKTIEEGSQIILFLTQSEIQGVEKILDAKAGMVYTLTNPGHYPLMLENKPTVNEAKIIRCVCNHRQSCEICARKSI